MNGELVGSAKVGTRPVDLSVYVHGDGYATLDRDRLYSGSVPASAYMVEGAPLGPVPSADTAELRANPDRSRHPLATQVALRLMVQNGEL